MLRVRGARIGTRLFALRRSARRLRRCSPPRRPPPASRGPDRRPTGMRALGRLERESVDDALPSARRARRSGARGQDDRQDLRRQPGRVLEARLVLPAVQHLPPHDARLHPRARAAAQARAAYDQALVEESTRNLQTPPASLVVAGRTLGAPELSSVVVLLPIVSPVARAGRSAAGHARRLEPALQHQLRVPGRTR